MNHSKLEDKLVDYIQDAHAMERDVEKMLESMINQTEDREIKAQLQQHLTETHRHRQLMEECLDRHDAAPSTRKQAQTMVSALAKSVVDTVRSDKPGKNARDGFVTEHMEIAAYEMLERLAIRAGDTFTADAARSIKADEAAMADRIEANWDRFLELTLREAEIVA